MCNINIINESNINDIIINEILMCNNINIIINV